MAKTIIDPDTNEEITVYTQEEIDAQIAAKEQEFNAKLKEKDDHVKEKLDQFTKGKTSQEQKDAERDAQIAEATRIAEEARLQAMTAEQRRVEQIEQYAIRNLVGDNAELAQKIRESMPIVNLEIKSDNDIMEKVRLAATISGVTGGAQQAMPVFQSGGGYAPQPKNDTVSDGDHEQFLKEVGLK